MTHVWFEAGEADRKLHWEFSLDGLSPRTRSTTRYAKFVTIPWIVTIPAAGLAKKLTAL